MIYTSIEGLDIYLYPPSQKLAPGKFVITHYAHLRLIRYCTQSHHHKDLFYPSNSQLMIPLYGLKIQKGNFVFSSFDDYYQNRGKSSKLLEVGFYVNDKGEYQLMKLRYRQGNFYLIDPHHDENQLFFIEKGDIILKGLDYMCTLDEIDLS